MSDTGGAQTIDEFAQGESGTGVLGSVTPYPKRVFTGFSPTISEQQKVAIKASVGYYGKPGGKDYAPVYSGEFLVDSNRLIARPPYSDEDVANELFKMRDGERLSTLDLLKTRGFYGNGKPSRVGTLSVDRTAFGEFLDYANKKGYTWQSLMREVADAAATYSGSGGSGSRIRVTPKEDIAAYLRKSSLERLGRTMNKADVDRAIAAIQQQEISKGANAPSTSVMAEQQVSRLQGGAEKAVRFRRAIDAAMSIVG